MLILFTIFIINIVLYFIIFNWLIGTNKYKCDCALTWKSYLIKYLLLFMLLITLILRFILKFNFIKNILLICEIFYIGMVLVYINDIVNKQCQCKYNYKNNYNNIIDIFIVILSLIILGFHRSFNICC